jgi:hypothetical protein
LPFVLERIFLVRLYPIGPGPSRANQQIAEGLPSSFVAWLSHPPQASGDVRLLRSSRGARHRRRRHACPIAGWCPTIPRPATRRRLHSDLRNATLPNPINQDPKSKHTRLHAATPASRICKLHVYLLGTFFPHNLRMDILISIWEDLCLPLNKTTMGGALCLYALLKFLFFFCYVVYQIGRIYRHMQLYIICD